jgi:hypothetical protein
VSFLSKFRYLVFQLAIYLSFLLGTHSIGPITNTFHQVHRCQRTSRTLNKNLAHYRFGLTRTMQHLNFPKAINLHHTNTHANTKKVKTPSTTHSLVTFCFQLHNLFFILRVFISVKTYPIPFHPT